MLKTWYSFLLCWLSLRLEANPGLKVRITQKGLDYGRRTGMELLKQAVLKETFPSWSGQESFSIVKVNYVISRIRINAVDFPETSASFIPGTGISLSVAHASATISADWRMNTWLLLQFSLLHSTLGISERFTCCRRQVKVENQLSGMQRVRDDEERGECGKKQVEEYRRYLWGKQSLLSAQLNANPGLKVRITQKGLEYAKEVGLEILKQNMGKEHFPDLSGYEKFGLGNVKYNISSKDSGRSTVYISKVFVTAIFSIPLDNMGHTSISLTSCRTTSGDIDIKLNGKSGFLHNFFIKYLKKPIHRSLVTNSCPNIRSGIQLIDEDLQSLNVLMPIDDLAKVDYSLNSSPAVFRPFIDLDLKGIVYPAGNHTGPPYVAAPFIIPDQSDSMLYLAFSEYFFQTSSFAYYTARAFDITIAEEVAKYSVTPYPVMLKLMATEIPVISLEQDSFTVEIQGSMEVFAVLPDSTTQSLFTMNVAANTSIALNIFDQKLMGSLCLNRLQFSLAHSNVGFFEVSG
ncbi:BPI fold-containing family C protein [Grus japonensis]|uniref:Bactericidal permeability-increasing protein n=1 Tax=Grus japonensis TaxID=30415 RepID=A0ABC9VU16_GRUJA